jgi:hypothetical protein
MSVFDGEVARPTLRLRGLLGLAEPILTTGGYGLSGPCFERANRTAPPSEGLPWSLRDDGEMRRTGRTGVPRA